MHRPPPVWVKTAYTDRMLAALRDASVESLSSIPLSASSDIREQRARILLSQFAASGLGFRVRILVYDRWVPVMVAYPALLGPDDPPIPEHLRVELTADEVHACESVRRNFDPPGKPSERQAAEQASAAARTETTFLGWEQSKLVVGRLDMYRTAVDDAAKQIERTGAITKLPAGFAIGMCGTLLGAATLGLDPNSLAAGAANCLSAVCGTASIASGPFGFFALVGLIGTAQAYKSCADALGRLGKDLGSGLNAESRSKQIGDALGQRNGANSYNRDGQDMTLRRGADSADQFEQTNPLDKEVQITRPNGYGGSGEFTDNDEEGCGRFEYNGYSCDERGDYNHERSEHEVQEDGSVSVRDLD